MSSSCTGLFVSVLLFKSVDVGKGVDVVSTSLFKPFKEHDEFTNIVPKIRPVNIILYMFFIDNNLHFILLYGFKS